ncbi:hypothetical protein CFIO01_07599 [Colletotrichum fioriniae PJ7]|uniref:Uncharacterized protein n=1 Tax=Colletotrichum fioriniae PJ7 TaxID=1445577 RepID=A0A010RZH8_9PEZI|nr:hypothetical protein CFIO01_07599 [Colletotrichum fioriniae PJ7]
MADAPRSIAENPATRVREWDWASHLRHLKTEDGNWTSHDQNTNIMKASGTLEKRSHSSQFCGIQVVVWSH